MFNCVRHLSEVSSRHEKLIVVLALLLVLAVAFTYADWRSARDRLEDFLERKVCRWIEAGPEIHFETAQPTADESQ